MLKNIKTSFRKLSLTVLSSVLLLQTGFILPESTKAQPPSKGETIAQNTNNSQATNFYKQAEQDLPENYYIIYRIVERIARANGLDETPWRLIATSRDNVNAYATEYNLMVFERGLLDRLEGNASAIACVIAHEMGHHVKQHLGYGPAEQKKAILEAIENAEREKLIAEQDAQTQAILGGAAGAGMRQGGATIGGTGGQVLGALGSILGDASQQQARNIEQIKAEIEQKAAERYLARLVEINHNQEYEADELGYIYSAKAGFKADGCLKTMELLGRSHGSQLGSVSHPAPGDRAKRIQELMVKYPPETLKQEGERRLKIKFQPLGYEAFDSINSNGTRISGLRIKPSTGDTKTDLDNLFSN